MDEISTEWLQDRLKFSEYKKFVFKCEIYCNNRGIDLEQYRVPGPRGKGHRRVYQLPIDLAIGITENVRMNNPNRADTLQELYKINGEKVVTQLHARKGVEFATVLQDTLNALGIENTKGRRIEVQGKEYILEMYLPKYNLAIAYDEFRCAESKDKEQALKKRLGCTFLRIDESLSLGEAIGTVLKSIK